VTTAACGLAAVVSLAVLTALGHWTAGLALGAGLVIGSANSWLVRQAMAAGVAFGATGLGRLGLLSVAGMGFGALLGVQYIPLVIGGLAAAQLMLAGVAFASAVRA
jgi:hypothetical protein